MQKVLRVIAGLICALAAPCTLADNAFAAQSNAPRVQAALIADVAGVRPGETVTVALRQTIAHGWHTYWVNPGDAGEPTTLNWKLPPGSSASAIRWPVPHVINIGPLVDYGYSDEVLLIVDVTMPQTLPPGSVEIAADARWLACKEICVPEEAALRLTLPVLDAGLTPRPSPNAAAIAAARKHLPEAAPWPVRFEGGKSGLMLTVDKFGATARSDGMIRFFPRQPDVISNTAPQKATIADGGLVLRMRRADGGVPAPATLEGVLVIEARDANGQLKQHGYTVGGPIMPSVLADAAVPENAAPNATTARNQPVAPAVQGASLSLWLAMVFAFLGGLTLNLMPCVFPVLSLKAFSLAQEKAPGSRHIHGLAYFAGVLASFIFVAAVIAILRGGGAAIGWGMQFQSPSFVLVMMALFMVLGLNMSGVFSLGERFSGAGDRLTHIPGLVGYFFTGVLATVVATPCTAPFMGAAVGYAFTQPIAQLFAVLLALGTGFAVPMVLLSVSPTVGRWLPKPGAWMVTFKGLMAFPLYATAGWLLWVLSQQQGSDGVLAAVITLVGVSFAGWLVGAAAEPGIWRSGVAVLVAAAAIIGGASGLTSEPQTPELRNSGGMVTGGLKYEAFSVARLEELRAQNKPVFVNLTAAWCITCLVNERVALRSVRVAEAFAGRGVVYLKGDWTNGNPEITAYLKSFDRAGVPLYVVYAGKGAPQVLPQFLTEAIVLDGIAAAVPQRQAAK